MKIIMRETVCVSSETYNIIKYNDAAKSFDMNGSSINDSGEFLALSHVSVNVCVGEGD